MEALGYEETYSPPVRMVSGVDKAVRWHSGRERLLSQSNVKQEMEQLRSPFQGEIAVCNSPEAEDLIRTRLESTCEISHSLSSLEMGEIAGNCEIWKYSPGEAMLVEGCRGNFLLVLHEGTANVYKFLPKEPEDKSAPPKSPQNQNKTAQAPSKYGDPIGIVSSGDIVGEIALLSGLTRCASVIATTHVTAVCIPGHVVLQLCQRNTAFANSLGSLVVLRGMSRLPFSTAHSKAFSHLKPYGLVLTVLALGIVTFSAMRR